MNIKEHIEILLNKMTDELLCEMMKIIKIPIS